MNGKKTKTAGILLALGALQWCICVLVAEGLHEGFHLSEGQWLPYSNQIHYVSELGVGATALIFNISTIVLGLAIIAGACLLYQVDRRKVFAALLLLAGVGAVGVGIFTTEAQPLHGIFEAMALILGAVAAVLSFRRDTPLSYVSVLLGLASLACSGVFFRYLGLDVNDLSTFAGLRKGVMERLVIYPIVFWLIGYGYQRASSPPPLGERAAESTSRSDG